MTNYVLHEAPADAFDHPDECSEPAPGEITSSNPITYNGTPIATEADVIEFEDHGHDTDEDDECTDFQSHEVNPEVVSGSVSYNSDGLCLELSDVATDPGSGGPIDFTSSGGNSAVTES